LYYKTPILPSSLKPSTSLCGVKVETSEAKYYLDVFGSKTLTGEVLEPQNLCLAASVGFGATPR